MNISNGMLADPDVSGASVQLDDVCRTETVVGTLQWVEIEPGVVIVANDDRSWLHRKSAFGPADPFSAPMEGEGSFASTKNLLDGALAAAQQAAHGAAARPPLTLPRWIWRLAGYYHTTQATPPLMAEAAELFKAAGKKDLEAYAIEKVHDESGHDNLAMADIRSLGYPPEKIIETFVPPTAIALVEHFRDCVRGAHPVRCIGYAYGLERLATSMDGKYVEEVERVLPKGSRATRCLRLHSGIGSDVEHVDDAIAITANQPAQDRVLIAQAAYRTAQIMFTVPPDGYTRESQLEEHLSSFIQT